MKIKLVILLSCFYAAAFSQQVEKSITEKNVSRVLSALSSDAMMGRPSLEPERMEKAISFIENEFKSIGLQYLQGLQSYRQEFEKEIISPVGIEVFVNGKMVPKSNVVLLSSKEAIQFSSGLLVKRIAKQENFYGSFSKYMKDSVDQIIIVDTSHTATFKRVYEHYSGERVLNFPYSKGTSIFILQTDSLTSYSVKASQKIKKIKLTNVVGVIPGKDVSAGSVVFSAHYDHLGIQSPVDQDSIANGADDDASGTTAVIELARYFNQVKNNKASLLFVAFTAEEIGGFGSQYFSKQLDPEKIIAMFNIEMIGKPSKWGQRSAFITGFERSDFGTILQKNLKGTKFKFYPDPYPEQNLFYRSDNATLARLGVPAHTISTDQIDSDKLYHTVNDEFESLNINNVTLTIQAIATSAKSIIMGNDKPSRIDKSQVK